MILHLQKVWNLVERSTKISGLDTVAREMDQPQSTIQLKWYNPAKKKLVKNKVKKKLILMNRVKKKENLKKNNKKVIVEAADRPRRKKVSYLKTSKLMLRRGYIYLKMD